MAGINKVILSKKGCVMCQQISKIIAASAEVHEAAIEGVCDQLERALKKGGADLSVSFVMGLARPAGLDLSDDPAGAPITDRA
jgi:cytochrome c551/c552